MQPHFRTGDVAVVRNISQKEAEKLRIGDVVTFRSLANPNILITHRIVQRLSTNSAAQYVTKGDANVVEDSTNLSSSRIVGRYMFAIPRAGYLIAALQNGQLLFTGVTAFAFASIALMLSRWAVRPVKEKENK